MLTVAAILIGIALGLIGGQSFMVIPWGVAGIIIGYFSFSKKQIFFNGFLYGFFLVFFFMVGGYRGSLPLIFRIPPFFVIGLIGGACGVIAGLIGGLFKKFLPAGNIASSKPWFNQKKYGYGWGLPATWQGWMVLLGYLVFIVYDFTRIDSHSHSTSDTFLNFFPQLILASVVLVCIVRITSGKPKWRWGKNGK